MSPGQQLIASVVLKFRSQSSGVRAQSVQLAGLKSDVRAQRSVLVLKSEVKSSELSSFCQLFKSERSEVSRFQLDTVKVRGQCVKVSGSELEVSFVLKFDVRVRGQFVVKSAASEFQRSLLTDVERRAFLLTISLGSPSCGSEETWKHWFVHKDLAARNCLVGMDMQVKVSDLGLSKELYPGDYVKMLRRSLPIRWMAPESIKANIFTRYSDIWAFGVLLWEMFSYGNKPYSYRGDNEVVVYLTRGGLLMKPDKCPVEAYNLMLGCWKEIPRDRTKFEVLQAKLKDLSIMETSL
ncbi:PREDICTED: insulin-like growth factor 1 receptor [Priapulus caudatus]|uniref:Insulin-like growth factor 1 receptor n=1 Tax=Priapulus caudatus TaxID=37621 RepID=A0ABM1EJ93_PRICU|nr:PREDICTED: insulin-like growth factor 1 receptor [Priapulus caudatus]